MIHIIHSAQLCKNSTNLKNFNGLISKKKRRKRNRFHYAENIVTLCLAVWIFFCRIVLGKSLRMLLHIN